MSFHKCRFTLETVVGLPFGLRAVVEGVCGVTNSGAEGGEEGRSPGRGWAVRRAFGGGLGGGGLHKTAHGADYKTFTFKHGNERTFKR
jgi:hypothetical protein